MIDDEIRELMQEEILRKEHNEKVRKNCLKYLKTGKFLGSDGKEINLGKTVNFEFVRKVEK